MAVDLHAVNLMRLAAREGASFSRVLTLGRLGLFFSDAELEAFCRDTGRPWSPEQARALRGDGFCERFLEQCFGAHEVTALDASPYDGAQLVHDLNVPVAQPRSFDAVLDFGCLEHVFNLPVALANVLAFCRDDGHILHVAPSNNWCGHGFYQFSPELFFSLYSEARGFAGTQVFLVENHQPSTWYRVRDPARGGKRVQVINRERTTVLVLTRKTSRAVSPVTIAPQQSDYVAQWQATGGEGKKARPPSRLRDFSHASGLSGAAGTVRHGLRRVRAYVVGHKERLRSGRADLERLDVRRLVSGP